jgi:hypothetical protein
MLKTPSISAGWGVVLVGCSMGGGEGCGVSLWSGLAIEQPAPCALVTAAPATNQRPPQNADHNVNANNVSLETTVPCGPLHPFFTPRSPRLAVCPPSASSERVPAWVASPSRRVPSAHCSLPVKFPAYAVCARRPPQTDHNASSSHHV